MDSITEKTALIMSVQIPYWERKGKKWLTTLSSFFSGVADAANKMQEGFGADGWKMEKWERREIRVNEEQQNKWTYFT